MSGNPAKVLRSSRFEEALHRVKTKRGRRLCEARRKYTNGDPWASLTPLIHRAYVETARGLDVWVAEARICPDNLDLLFGLRAWQVFKAWEGLAERQPTSEDYAEWQCGVADYITEDSE